MTHSILCEKIKNTSVNSLGCEKRNLRALRVRTFYVLVTVNNMHVKPTFMKMLIEVDTDKESIMFRAIGMLLLLVCYCHVQSIYDMVIKEKNCFFL